MAFIAAVLKNRPICVFDELAADQDPQFRHVFYTQLLPELRDQGQTIIAVTHDDAYFAQCDRLLRLENGRLVCDFMA